MSTALRLSCRNRLKRARWLLPASLCALTAAAIGLPQTATGPPALLPAERVIVDSPFASPGVRTHLQAYIAAIEARRAGRALLPAQPIPPHDPRTMGWRLSDEAYWSAIPAAARTIPKDWSKLPGISFENSQLGGMRQLRLAVGPEYDQWLLDDPTHKLFACISIQRLTGRIYFMEVARSTDAANAGEWVYHAAFDNCYSCHPSGLRVIRPLNEQGVETATLARFNRRILAYRTSDFGDSLDEKARGEPIDDKACTGCHDGTYRSRLYGIHSKTIEFKKELERTMPPR